MKNKGVRIALIAWLVTGILPASVAHLDWDVCYTEPRVPPRIDWIVILRHPFYEAISELFLERVNTHYQHNLEFCYTPKRKEENTPL